MISQYWKNFSNPCVGGFVGGRGRTCTRAVDRSCSRPLLGDEVRDARKPGPSGLLRNPCWPLADEPLLHGPLVAWAPSVHEIEILGSVWLHRVAHWCNQLLGYWPPAWLVRERRKVSHNSRCWKQYCGGGQPSAGKGLRRFLIQSRAW